MKAHKKTKSQNTGQWKGIPCNTLTKAGNIFAPPFGINFMLAPSPQFSSTLPSCLQLFAPAQVALLGLAQLEAQLVLNQLSNIAVSDHNGYCNHFLPSMIHTYLSQNTPPLSLCQPPRAVPYPLPKTSHAPCNPASGSDIYPSVYTDKQQPAKAKHQSSTGMMIAPQEQKQTLGSHLGKDKQVQADLHEAPLAAFSCNHQGENQKIQIQTRSSVLFPEAQYIYQHKSTRTAPVAAPSRNTSRGVFEYGHRRKKSPKGLAHSTRNNQFWACSEKGQSGRYEQRSPSQSISPSPSWSPSPPPVSHKRSAQSPHSSDRYSPSDVICGCYSSEHRSSRRTGEFSSSYNLCQESLKNRQGDLILQDGDAFLLTSSFSSYKSSKSSSEQHASSPDLNGRVDVNERNTFSGFSAGHSHRRCPSFKIMKKDDYYFSASLNTVKQTSSQNPLQKTKNITKKEKEPCASVVFQPSKTCLNTAPLVCLSGIPAEAKYKDVCQSLAPFGGIKELVFLPEPDTLSQVLAFLHMLKEEDAEALSKCRALTIRNKVITVVPHHQEQVTHPDAPQGIDTLLQPMVLMESSEPHLITTPEVEKKKGVIRISGIPFDCSEDDLIKLVSPFGQPIRICIATEIDVVNDLDWRMALVVLLDEPSAIDIVKVYSVVPVHLKQFDVMPVLQTVDFSSPVSLFQAFTSPIYPSVSTTATTGASQQISLPANYTATFTLTGSATNIFNDLLVAGKLEPHEDSLTPWENLLVVSNVPEQPHIATEVLQLVQPFGKVLRTLALSEKKSTDKSLSDDQNTHCIKIVFEMMSSVNVSLACEWSQKSPYVLYGHHLCFSMGTKPQQVKSKVTASGSKSWKEIVSEENCKVKHHDLSPWIQESEEGILVFISGFPETMNSEEDFIQMAAPHGVPTKVVIAAAQRKALVQLPDKHSAQKMVAAYNAIPIGLKQLDVKLLPNTVDISKSVSLYQVIMGPEESGGKTTDLHHLLTAVNVPDTVGGISQVQQLVQRYGAVNRTLILNNMVIFEMMTSNAAKSAYKQLKMRPYTVHSSTLSFVWGSDLSTTVKEGAEGVPFIGDFVSVDEVVDVTAFQNDASPLSAEAVTSTQPNRRPDTNIAGEVRSTEVIQHFAFSGEKQKQTYDKIKEEGKEARKRGQGQQGGTINNVQPGSSNISDSQVKPLDVSEQRDQSDNRQFGGSRQGLMHRRECLIQKAKTFLRKRNSTRPVFPEGYCLVSFNPECPIGTEFLEQKSSFFCKVCKRFSVGDEDVKEIHCRSFKHYKNLERCLQNWLQKRSCSEPYKLGR